MPCIDIENEEYAAKPKGRMALKNIAQTIMLLRTNGCLVHRCSKMAEQSIRNPYAPLNLIFKPGRESKKWFAIGGAYTFTKPSREEAEYYNGLIAIEMSGPLLEWFEEYLIYEKYPPGKTRRDERNYLLFNPCCKKESEQITIGIPSAVFNDFLFMADFFPPETEDEMDPEELRAEKKQISDFMRTLGWDETLIESYEAEVKLTQ